MLKFKTMLFLWAECNSNKVLAYFSLQLCILKSIDVC